MQMIPPGKQFRHGVYEFRRLEATQVILAFREFVRGLGFFCEFTSFGEYTRPARSIRIELAEIDSSKLASPWENILKNMPMNCTQVSQIKVAFDGPRNQLNRTGLGQLILYPA